MSTMTSANPSLRNKLHAALRIPERKLVYEDANRSRRRLLGATTIAPWNWLLAGRAGSDFPARTPTRPGPGTDPGRRFERRRTHRMRRHRQLQRLPRVRHRQDRPVPGRESPVDLAVVGGRRRQMRQAGRARSRRPAVGIDPQQRIDRLRCVEAGRWSCLAGRAAADCSSVRNRLPCLVRRLRHPGRPAADVGRALSLDRLA